MTRPSSAVVTLASLTGWVLFLGVLFDRPELFIAAVPLVVALFSARQPPDLAGLRLSVEVSENQVIEGEPFAATLTLVSSQPIPFLELLVPLPANLTLATGRNLAVVAPGASQEVRRTFDLRSLGRGQASIGPVHLRASDRSGLCVREARLATGSAVRIYPRVPRVRALPPPQHTRSSFGNYTSKQLGEGLESGEVRAFVPGDQARRVNWRATLRLGRLYVTQFHQERNADVVLLLDSYADTGARPNSSLDASVRAAGAIAGGYLSRRDRVGLVEVGGMLRWMPPASGRRQFENLIRALSPAEVMFTYLVRNLDVVSPRVLPPQALIIAVTPLIDGRFVKVLENLAARQFDLLVLAVSPVEVTCRALAPSPIRDLACHLWSVERRVLIDDLRSRGLMILEWEPGQPLEGPLAALSRRTARRVMR